MHYGIGAEISDSAGLMWTVCQQLDGRLSGPDLVASIARTAPADPGDVQQIVDFLIASGWVEDAGAPPPPELSTRECERYERGIQLQSWIDQKPRTSRYELQARLKNSRVTVVGLGGIGSAVAASLAASGVGAIHCVDGDRVELSNLNRQLLFSEADIGRSKVDAGVERLRRLNSDIAVTGADGVLASPSELARQVAGSDLFVLCADRPRAIEQWADQVSRELGLPWVIASYAGPKLAVGTFVPGSSPCYGCLLGSERERMAEADMLHLLDLDPTPGFNPVMATTAQISGNVAAMEALNLLLGWEVQTAGGQLHWNFTDYDHRHFFAATPRPDCPACAGLIRVDG